MSGRGRGRPPSRSAQESAAGPSRRSTRQQQQQQNAAEPQHDDQEPHPESPPPQEEQQQEQQQQQFQEQQQQQQQQLDQLQPQLEAAMPAPNYHQIIDPAITGPQDAGMPPPPVPSAKNLRGQTISHAARRGTRRDMRASSMASTVNSIAPTDAYSSQPEPHNVASQRSLARVFSTPVRGGSVLSSQADETPSRRVASARLMNVMLRRLFTASDDLFTHLYTDREDPEMWDAERDGFKKAFDAYRNHYVPDESNPFVSPTFVVDTLRFARTSSSEDDMLKIVSAANLTSLLDEITPIHQEILLPLLQGWDSMFPENFVDSNDRWTNEQIIEQALMIRTHLSIFTLQKLQRESPSPFHPFEQVSKIWCDGDVSVADVEAFLRNNNDALQLKPITAADSDAAALARDRTSTRFKSLCTMLPHYAVERFNLDLGQIFETFPFEDFVDNLRTFVRTYFTSIKASLQQGSLDGRDQSLPLASSDATSRVDSQIRSQLETEAMAHTFDRAESGTPSLSYNMDSLRRMKQLEQQASAAYGDGHQLPPGSYPPAPRIPYPPGFSSPTSTPGLMYAESANQGMYQPDGAIYAESAAQTTGRKRRSEDDGAAGSAPPQAKKPRVRRKKNDVPVPSASPLSAAVATSTPAAPPAIHSQYPPLPGSQDEPDFDALTQRTKEISAATRKAREPQVRSAWVRNDVRLLVKAVDTYSCKWSTIEKEIKRGTIPFERPRDQQALRDKARLLKQDFLKADAILPRGFDYVVLGKKEREAVKACGKNPDRKEGDVDENGHPISTELGEDGMPAPLPALEPAPLPAPLPSAEAETEPQPVAPEPVAV